MHSNENLAMVSSASIYSILEKQSFNIIFDFWILSN